MGFIIRVLVELLSPRGQKERLDPVHFLGGYIAAEQDN